MIVQQITLPSPVNNTFNSPDALSLSWAPASADSEIPREIETTSKLRWRQGSLAFTGAQVTASPPTDITLIGREIIIAVRTQRQESETN